MGYQQPVLYDIKGREIKEFDLLKVYHFTDTRNRKHYIYKWVRLIRGLLRGVHLNQDFDAGGRNSYILTPTTVQNSEIIQRGGSQKTLQGN